MTWEPIILKKTEAQKEFIFADTGNWLKEGANRCGGNRYCTSPCAGVLLSVGACPSQLLHWGHWQGPAM